MAKDKHRNVTNRNQGNMAASEPNSPLTACPEYPITPEKQDLKLKSLVMILVEEHMCSCTSIMTSDFKFKSCFSGVMGYPGHAVKGELGSDAAILP